MPREKYQIVYVKFLHINPKCFGIYLTNNPVLKVLGPTKPDCTYLTVGRPMAPTRGCLTLPSVNSLRTVTW